jgi:hypothetical protein
LLSRKRALGGVLVALAAALTIAAGVGSASTKASPPAINSRPTISGTLRDGATLTASHGAWFNSPTSYAYQWQRCNGAGSSCNSIPGADSSQYVLTTSDIGHRMRVVVTARNSAGSGTATSDPTGVVRSSGSAPSASSKPTISGNPQEDQTLSVAHASWQGTKPISVADQWQRCDASGANCADLAGATGTTYNATSADVGHTLRVRETASNSRGTSAVTSDPTALIAPAKAGASGAAISVAQVSLPDRLVIDGVKFTPNPLRSRRAFVARFHVSDTRGFSIQGAMVYALGLPYSWTQNAAEQPTNANGWATIVLQPTRALPIHRGGALVIFVRARKPGENLLAGVSTRRLVQESVG